ncbi:hypothetical protein ACQP3C_28370, partial [Escherichia coli]
MPSYAAFFIVIPLPAKDILKQNRQAFPVKGEALNVLGFGGHMVWSLLQLLTSVLCQCAAAAFTII